MKKTTILNMILVLLLLVLAMNGRGDSIAFGEALFTTLFLIVPFWVLSYKRIKNFNASEKGFLYISSLFIYNFISEFMNGVFYVIRKGEVDVSIISIPFIISTTIYYIYLWRVSIFLRNKKQE